jgi:tetratricopeptide (TPR) repeat protein
LTTNDVHRAASPVHLARCTLHRALFVFTLASVAVGCRGPARNLLPVSLPDLVRVDSAVQQQARERHASLTKALADRQASAADLARAYGDFGMLLHAAEYYEAAEPCYLNAQALAPEEPRWPYYLGHLHQRKGETDKAERAFKRVLEIRADQEKPSRCSAKR